MHNLNERAAARAGEGSHTLQALLEVHVLISKFRLKRNVRQMLRPHSATLTNNFFQQALQLIYGANCSLQSEVVTAEGLLFNYRIKLYCDVDSSWWR